MTEPHSETAIPCQLIRCLSKLLCFATIILTAYALSHAPILKLLAANYSFGVKFGDAVNDLYSPLMRYFSDPFTAQGRALFWYEKNVWNLPLGGLPPSD